MKKKILMISTYFPPSGGVGVFRITKFAKYLKYFGYDVVVVTIDNKYCINKDLTFINDIKDLKIYRLNFKTKKSVSKDFSKCLKKQLPGIIKIEKPNLVFITGGPFHILPIGRFVYNKFKIPYIIDLRDPWSLQKIQGKNLFEKIICKIIRLRDTILEKITFSKAKYICVVNDSMKNEYKKKYPYYSFEVITNGYDQDDFSRNNPFNYGKFSICYTGKFSVSAGFRDPSNFFKALNKLDDVYFYHVGNIEQDVVKLSKKYGCYDKCNFLGFQEYNKTISYQKGASILLIISGDESSEQTGKIFDYIGSNKPILALTNKNNEIYKICKEFDNIYVVDKNDVDSIVEEINKIKKISLKKQSKKQIEKYSRKELTKKLIELIEK